MINHVFSCLYGYAVPAASGIYVPLTSAARYSDVLASGLQGVRGSTPAEAEAFAIHSVKVIEASSYASELTARDPRLTYRGDEIGVDLVSSSEFLAAIVGLPGAVLAEALAGADIVATFRDSKIPQERAAAVLVGLARKVSDDNGY